MKQKNHSRQRGYTILEIMIVILIVGVLFGLAVPSFQAAMVRNNGRTVVTQWQESFYFAQSEAMRLQNRVSLCASTDGQTCNGATFAQGWIVFDTGNNSRTGESTVLRDVPSPDLNGLTITNNTGRKSYDFDGAGRLSGFVGDTITFTVTRGGSAQYSRVLTLNREGRIQ